MQAVADSLQERGSQRLNSEQRTAVASVLLRAGGPRPYALFGPPGTGKTVTLVECALQVQRVLVARTLGDCECGLPVRFSSCLRHTQARWFQRGRGKCAPQVQHVKKHHACMHV